jgi:hypothetical protein
LPIVLVMHKAHSVALHALAVGQCRGPALEASGLIHSRLMPRKPQLPFLPYAVSLDPADGFSDIGRMYC